MENSKVLYEKPKLNELSTVYTIVDMHMHSRYSDGINKIDAIAKRAKKLGIGVAITDHNEIKGALEIDKYKTILTIPGIEATSKEGTHIIFYFYNTEDIREFYKRYIKPYFGADLMSSLRIGYEDLIKGAKEYKSLIIFPHPYSVAYTGIVNKEISKEKLTKILKKVDGVEVLNSENLHKWNLKSTILGFNLAKCMTGGSDGHTLYHLGKVVTCAKCKNDRISFLNAVKKKDVRIVGKEIDILRKVTANSFKLKKSLKNYPEVIERNLRYNYRILKSKRKHLSEKVRYKMVNSRIFVKLKK